MLKHLTLSIYYTIFTEQFKQQLKPITMLHLIGIAFQSTLLVYLVWYSVKTVKTYLKNTAK
jgi:hypothetical protein